MMVRSLVLVALCASAVPASAQSLFNAHGLGVPMDAIDARARALGSIGTGLLGLNPSMVNPADLGGIRRRGVVAVLQPFFGSDEVDGRTDDVEGTRFPLIQLMYPFRSRLVFALGFGGFLEQSWSVTSAGETIIDGQPVPTRELTFANGALTQVRFSGAYDVNESVALGAAFGVFTGNIRRGIARTFPDTLIDFVDFEDSNRWAYQGYQGVVGVRIDPTPTSRVSAALTWNSRLDADPQVAPFVDHRSYSMPLRVSAGASAIVAPRLLATASAQYTAWDDAENYASPGAPLTSGVIARPVWEAGGGLEWEQLRKGTRIFPLRAGFRYGQLPFHVTGDDPANEWAVSAGIGLRLAGDAFGPLAVADISVERGRRAGWQGLTPNGLTENFWRLGASIALFGR